MSLSATGSIAPGAISIFVHTDKQSTPYPNNHSNLIIENNIIQEISVADGIHAYAVNGLLIRNNTLLHTNLIRSQGTDSSTGLFITGIILVSTAVNVTLENNHILQ